MVFSLVALDNEDFTSEEINDPIFLDSLRFLPVKFKKEDKGILKAEFPSGDMAINLEFKLLENDRGGFYKLGKVSNERISRAEFLKKIKNDNWWLVYRQIGDENFIYAAYQIQNIRALQLSYAYDPYDNYQRVDNYHFWQAIRLTTASVYSFDKSSNKASWAFLKPIKKDKYPTEYDELDALINNYDKAIDKLKSQNLDSPLTAGDVSKELGLPIDKIFIESKNNTMIMRAVRIKSSIYLIMRQDYFELSPYCVFSIDSGLGQEKPVDRIFFESNFNKYNWVIFYNPDSKIALRMVAIGEPATTSPK